MKKLLVLGAGLALLLGPQQVQAQEPAPEEAIISISKFHVPMGEDRAKVMRFIEEVMMPQEVANPHVQSFYVLNHLYGASAEEVLLVRVYNSWADVEAPCGEPCDAWAESMPQPGTPEREELMELGQLFNKYYSAHSDEIYSSTMGHDKG